MVVGQGALTKEFAAHEGHLSDSLFFRNALKKEWREGQTRKIELPDDEPETVRLYLHFLYTQQVPDDLIFSDWARLYVFGQKVLDRHLKNAVLQVLLQEVQTIDDDFFVAEAVNIIYDGTPSESMGRKLLVDMFHAARDHSWVEDQDFRQDFWEDLVRKFMRTEERPDLGEMTIKPYLE